jgi:hypothetical protein
MMSLCRSRSGGLHHVEGQTVEQVGAKVAFLHHLRQVGVGRAHQTDVNLQRLAAAHALQFAIFNHAQQLFLYQHRRCRQLIEKQRPAVGALKAPGMALAGAGKGAGFMAEQLRIEQIFIQRRAVQRDKRPLPAGERKCRRLAISSFPVPRSPMTSTGLSSGASRETCSSTSRKLLASPSSYPCIPP